MKVLELHFSWYVSELTVIPMEYTVIMGGWMFSLHDKERLEDLSF